MKTTLTNVIRACPAIFRLALLVLANGCAGAATFDLVLTGGRVMDPATGLDARRNIGISAGKIAAISDQVLAGATVINVAGQVVAPGFIDLHAHGQTTSDLAIKARDGVTTALELEIGVYPLASWYESMAGKSPINYGATVGHPGARYAAFRPEARAEVGTSVLGRVGILPRARAAEVLAMEKAIRGGLAEGGLGVGFGINYTPTADTAEIEAMFRVAAAAKVPVFVHTRAFGIAAIKEAIDTAKKAKVALHIVHVGSSSIGDLREVLPLIDSTKAAGFDITTEVYPYIAASTRLESAMFDDGWQKNLGIDYGDVVWADTGERLTKESFARYRKTGGFVIMYMMKDENIERAIAHPGVIIASDGVPFIKGKGHPRGAGTFARVLGHYSRDKKLLSLMDALAKMTILPARRLEHVPAMRTKGRIAVGADADLTVFDPATVIDRATFEAPTTPSAGISQVVVNGVVVVRDGELVKGAMPGRAVRRALQKDLTGPGR